MTRIFREGGERVFDPKYLPKALPHREKQLDILKKVVSEGLDGSHYSIPVLYGESGTGKTSTLRKVLTEIKEEREDNIDFRVVNATTHSRTYVAIQYIAKKIVPIPERGLGIDEIITKLYDRLDIEELKYIVAIDDGDELIRRDRGKILEILTRIEEGYERRLIYPILVLRKMEILSALPPHITSKVGGPRIEFPPYDKRQFKDILKERIELGFNEDVITQNAVEAATYAAEKIFLGNARELLNIVFKAGKKAEYEGDLTVTSEHIRNAIYEIYSKTMKPDIVSDKKKERIVYRVLWTLTKLIHDQPDIYWLTEDILNAGFDLYMRNFMEKISYDEYIETIEEIAVGRSRIITYDGGQLVFLSYPAKKLYEDLTRTLFLRG
jgi:cell division control protein 6